MGSDLHMNPPYEPPKPLSEQVANLEDALNAYRTQLSAVIAEKSRLEAQARRDEQTIVRLTRERDAAQADLERIISG